MAITKEKLAALKPEIKRFIKAFTDAEKNSREEYPSPKQKGAVRRASMDLTRALADFRRSGE